MCERPGPHQRAGGVVERWGHQVEDREQAQERPRRDRRHPGQPRQAPGRALARADPAERLEHHEHEQHIGAYELQACAHPEHDSGDQRPAPQVERRRPHHRRDGVDIERPDPPVHDQQVVGGHQRGRSERGPPAAARGPHERIHPQDRERAEHDAPETPGQRPVAEQLDPSSDQQLRQLWVLGVRIDPQRGVCVRRAGGYGEKPANFAHFGSTTKLPCLSTSRITTGTTLRAPVFGSMAIVPVIPA